MRDHGVRGNKPIHTLRKEFGSQINVHHGIHATSMALGHSDIHITSQYYVDGRSKRAPPGLGPLLEEPEKVTPIEGKALEKGREAASS